MKKPLSLIILLIIIALNIYARFINSSTNPISWDVFGYYLYLPFTFIYNDLGLQNKDVLDSLIEIYKSTNPFYQATMSPSGYWIMKYSSGMAVLYSPGFFAGHIWALLSNYPADGFSLPYRISLLVNGTLFFLLGQIFFRKVLLNFFSDKLTAIILVLIYFGTNFYAYTAWSAEMAHNYIFTLYALVVWFTIKWHNKYKLKYLVALAITIGLMTLSRPTELIAILIPLLWGVFSWSDLKNKLALLISKKTQLIVFSSILILIGSIQIIYWKIYSGSFIYYSYVNPGEGFEFLWPYTLKVLFSFRKGWFIYTPLMLFAVFGFITLYKKNKKIFIPIFLFFLINLWIVSSWSCWWYAQSFGQRALVQSYVIMAIPLGYFIQSLENKKVWTKVLFVLLGICIICLNQFQNWQLRKGILNGDRMTPSYYFKTFGKTSVSKEDKKLLLVNRFFGGKKEIFYNESKYDKRVIYLNDFEKANPKHICDSISHSGNSSIKMDASFSFSPSYKAKYKDITNEYFAWVRASVWVYPLSKIEQQKVLLVITCAHNGKAYKYRVLDIAKENLELNKWNEVKFDYLTPEVRSKNDEISVYIWNRSQKETLFDDLQVTVFD